MTEDRVPTHILRCTMHDECDLDLRALVAEQPAPPLDVQRFVSEMHKDAAKFGWHRMDTVKVRAILRRLGSVPSRSEPTDENVELLRRLDDWTDGQNAGPLIRWAAAHLRGCVAAPSRSEPE